MGTTLLDLLTLDAEALQLLLTENQLTSVGLVRQILAQIEREDVAGMRLNAMITLMPEELLIKTAAQLDHECADGRIRGPLHGIPIIVKDAIATHPDLGMGTTVGSYALVHSRPAKSAMVVDKLIERGLIILGKTNLNELCNFKGSKTTNGWSPVGGQTQSAYVLGGLKIDDGSMGHSNPCGSSTGSAVGVSAGFSPLSLGTETQGSLVQPATRAALYSMKPTIGSVYMDGAWSVSKHFDVIGVLAKSVQDLANAMEIIVTPSVREKLPIEGFVPFLTKSFHGLNVGFLSPNEWHFPPDKCRPVWSATQQMNSIYTAAIAKIKDNGATTTYPVSIPLTSELVIDNQSTLSIVTNYDYSNAVNEYLSSLQSSDMHNIEDIIEFNSQHADQELPEIFPDQSKLIDASRHRPSEELYERALHHMAVVARDRGIDNVFREFNLNMLAMPMDSDIPGIAAAAGYPLATMPLGLLDYNGRPFGLGVIALAHREDLIFQFMSAFEAAFPKRKVPPALAAKYARLDKVGDSSL